MSRNSLHMIGAVRFFVCGIVMVICLGWQAGEAAGQGTMGTVPDPISSRELDGYAKRLGLSEQQRRAMESFHDQYKAEFAQLREGEIERFLTDNRGGPGGGMGMMFNVDRKQVQKAIADLESIQTKIKAIDNRLFEQIQTVLTEDQSGLMQSVRQARERARYRTGLGRMPTFLNPATMIDLSELASDLDLSAQEKQDAAPVLSQYEASLTSAARKLHDGANNLMLEMLDKLKAQGFGDDAMRAPENRGRMFEAFRTIWSELNSKLMERASDISDLNRRTTRSLAAVLTEDHSRKLRDRYYQRAYPEARMGGAQVSRAFELAMKFEGLSDDQRQAIASMASDFFSSMDRITAQMADAIDENRKTQSFFDFDSEKRRKFQEQIDSLRERREKLNDSALTSLKSALGPELQAKLDQRLAQVDTKSESLSDTVTFMAGPGMGMARIMARSQTSADNTDVLSDPSIPPPIARRDVERYASRLRLDEGGKTVLSSLHDDYMEKYRALEQREFKAVRDAEGALWLSPAAGQNDTQSPPSPQAIDELYSLRRKAFEAVKAIDGEFFGDVKVSLSSKEQELMVDRIEQSRMRQIYSAGTNGGFMGLPGPRMGGPGIRGPRFGGRGGPMGMFGGESEEASVDLSVLIEDVPVQPTNASQFESQLMDYEQRLTLALQKTYESSMKVQQAMEKLGTQMMRQVDSPRGEGRERRTTVQAGPTGGGGFRELMEGDGRIAREARTAVTTLNRQTLTSLMSGLNANDAQNLKRAYNRKAFAGVYHDPRCAEPKIVAALKLDDLTDQQRTAIQELATEYRGGYDELCEKMIELQANAADLGALIGSGGGGGRGDRGQGGRAPAPDWQAFQEQMRTRERLDFERNDLNDKTIARLRSMLNEQQIQRLGGLQTDQRQASN